MLITLKLIFTIIILLCFFLPLSQCELKNEAPVDVETGQAINPHEPVYEVLVLSETLTNSQTEFGLEHILVLLTFFMPFIFCFTSKLKGVVSVISLFLQLGLSVWLIYFSKEVIFFLSTPLIAGWILIFSSVAYLVIIAVECCLIVKHNKIKNWRTLRVLGRAEDARPF